MWISSFLSFIHWRDYPCPHTVLIKTYLTVFVQVDFLDIDSVLLFLCQYAAVLITLTFYYIFKQKKMSLLTDFLLWFLLVFSQLCWTEMVRVRLDGAASKSWWPEFGSLDPCEGNQLSLECHKNIKHAPGEAPCPRIVGQQKWTLFFFSVNLLFYPVLFYPIGLFLVCFYSFCGFGSPLKGREKQSWVGSEVEEAGGSNKNTLNRNTGNDFFLVLGRISVPRLIFLEGFWLLVKYLYF